MIIIPNVPVVAHEVMHAPDPLATSDVLEGNIHFNPTTVDVVAVIVDETLFDTIVSKWTVTACRAPPLRCASEYKIWRHLELDTPRV